MNSTKGTVKSPFDYQAALRMDGQGVVVLGAGPGLGTATASALVQSGAQVICVDQDPATAKAAARASGGHALACDVTDEQSFSAMIERAERTVGGVHGIVDVVGFSKMGGLSSLSYADWHNTFRGVVDHAFLALTIGVAAIERSGGGALCFVGSNSGLSAVKGQAAYGAAKAALHHLVACMGPELGPKGIRVNSVAPSFIRDSGLEGRLTAEEWSSVVERIPTGRAATPADVASAVLFLMSPMAAHISGQVLPIDGAFTRIMQLPPMPWHRDLD